MQPVRGSLSRVVALALVAALSALPGARVGARDGDGLRLVICGAFGAFEVAARDGLNEASGTPALCCLPAGALFLPDAPFAPSALPRRRGVFSVTGRARSSAGERPRRAHPPRAPPAV